MVLSEKQKLLKKLAETAVLQDKVQRVNFIKQMHDIIQEITQDQLIEVINSINAEPAMRFLIPAGVYDRARDLVFARLAVLQGQRA